ncbi:MAG: CCDC90 family protein [Acidobacteria bacterium]|nr:CCDC90 family protein [Acidobacteriota bacterium]
MSTVTFDTLKFVERLKAAGVPEAQAKAMAEAQQEALSESVATQFATKADLAELKLGMIKWMAGLALAQVSLSIGLSVKLL